MRGQETADRKAPARDRMRWHFEARHIEGKWKNTVGTNKATQSVLAKLANAELDVDTACLLHKILAR
jgi:hypothetical protein